MNIEIKKQSLFVREGKLAAGVGYHNIHHTLPASTETVLKAVDRQYKQRCGHVPMDNVDKTFVLVTEHDDTTTSQMQYLTEVFGRKIEPKTVEEIKRESVKLAGRRIIAVPYINTPETEIYLREAINPEIFGLPSEMVAQLKNKAEFHMLIKSVGINGLDVPDFIISDVDALAKDSKEFLRDQVDGLYKKYNMADYPRGLMIRPSESDGNYGAGMVCEKNGDKLFMPEGLINESIICDSWDEALANCQNYVKGTMNTGKEKRVVVSRLIDLADSPGMSIAILDGAVESFGWSRQIQNNGMGCVGSGIYKPRDNFLRDTQEKYESKTANLFAQLLKQLAEKKGIDFNTIRGFANIDIMIPGQQERELQMKRMGGEFLYLAESNPRFTNYTDALLTGVAAQRLPQTISSMRNIIAHDMQAEDKFELPDKVDPRAVRDEIYKKDIQLKEIGTRIIARMTVAPMGIIFLGDTMLARRELTAIVDRLTELKGR